jgi:hypothetical protein
MLSAGSLAIFGNPADAPYSVKMVLSALLFAGKYNFGYAPPMMNIVFRPSQSSVFMIGPKGELLSVMLVARFGGRSRSRGHLDPFHRQKENAP